LNPLKDILGSKNLPAIMQQFSSSEGRWVIHYLLGDMYCIHHMCIHSWDMPFERSLFQTIEHHCVLNSLNIQLIFCHQILAMTRTSADTGRGEQHQDCPSSTTSLFSMTTYWIIDKPLESNKQELMISNCH
jgi:hypothetical protein